MKHEHLILCGPSAFAKKVFMKQDSLSDSAFPACRRCHQPIKPTSEDCILDRFGGFARLRCSATECGHEDWYKEPIMIAAPDAVPPVPEGSGEVWIHDVILGLSFKAESNTNLEGAAAPDVIH